MAIALPSTPKGWLAVAAVVAGLAVALWALFASKSDAELIRERLDELGHVVAVDGDENLVFRGNRMKDKLSKIFTPAVRVDIQELAGRTSGRDELVLIATRAGTYFRHAEVDVDADAIDVIEGSNSATVRGTVTITGDRGGGPERDERKVTFGFAKVEGEWMIDSVVVTPKNPDAAPLLR